MAQRRMKRTSEDEAESGLLDACGNALTVESDSDPEGIQCVERA